MHPYSTLSKPKRWPPRARVHLFVNRNKFSRSLAVSYYPRFTSIHNNCCCSYLSGQRKQKSIKLKSIKLKLDIIMHLDSIYYCDNIIYIQPT